MKGLILLLLAAVALSKGARLSWNDCINQDTVNVLVPHENCQKFYQCDDGKLIPRKCPANLMFNVDDQRCDWPENVDCKNRGTSEESDENEPESETGGGHNDPSEAPAICAEEDADGILIAHEYCNKYYVCSDGIPVAMSCPADLFFNPDIDQCDWPKNVECNREVAPQPKPDDSDENVDGNETEEVDLPEPELQPEPEPVPQPEPEAENDAGNENEDNKEPVGNGNGDPSEATEICAAVDSDGILIAHEYCNKYYICSEGRPVAKPCPPGLFFNANKDQCDWPENVECDREVAPQPQPEASDEENESETAPEPVPEPDNGSGDENGPIGGGNGDPSEAPEICAAVDSDGILIAHEYCNKYYICSEGRPVAKPCPPGLFFNANKDQCDWPENVECDREVAPQPQPEASDEENEGETAPEPVPETDNGSGDENGPIGGGNGDPSEAPEICAAVDSDGILITHEYCNKYYICNEGRPVAKPCPPGLFFNANKDQCDWPENVECDREVAPQPQPEASDEENEGETAPEPVPETDNGSGDENGPIGGGNGDPSEAPEICAAAESDGILITHEYCNKYYICSEGRPVAKPCPPGLFFNANKDQCDWPENVECDREVAPQPEPEASDEENEGETAPEPVPETDNGSGDENGPIGGGNGDPSEAPEICAAVDSDGILIAHEYCNKYYICSEGRPVAKPCPPGLFFNANKDQCDWPENVECDREVAPQPQPEASDEENEGETAPEPVPETDNGSGDENGPIGGGNGDPSEAPEICAAADSEGILIAHEYCNKYYICSEGRPVAKPCPPGLFFNANKDQCDWPENVECDREVAPQPQPEASDEENEGETAPEPVPETDNGSGDENGPIGGGNGDPSEAPEICAAVDSDGILIAHEYCNKYYICSEGRPVAKPCPPGLFFNANKDQCDWPENVECDREVAPQPQPEASDEENEGETAPESVPETDNGSGDENGPIGGGNGDPSEAPEICAAVDSDGILTAHEYCNKYYICSEGRPVAKPCPPGLFFNANKDQCDWPENVECDREVAPQPQPEASDEENEGETAPEPVPETDNGSGDENGPIGGGNGDPSEAPEICAAVDSDGILIAHEYCNKYYICSEGRPVAKPCPPGLFFNANKDQCDWPEDVECDREVAPQPQPEASDEENEGETAPEPVPETDNGSGDENGPIGGGNGDPSEAPEICAAAESDGILIAHEYCNKYYICSEGRPVAKPCPPGLFFNANKDQCDWPENVECNREVAPQPQPEASDEENEGETAPEPVPETDNGSGDENGPIGGGNGDPSEAPEICAAVDSDGILIAHEYCNKNYICSEGRPVAKPCPPGLFFNANKDQCDWPENVECDREVAPQPQPEASDEENEGETAPEPVPETDNGSGDENGPIGGGNGDPSEAPEICAAAESDGILIAHEYCNKYYICSEGRPVAKPCPPGLFFNANKDQCDWPENVECDREVAPQPQPEASDEENEGETAPEPVPETDNGSGDENGPIGGGNGDPSEAPEICAAVDSDGILIAHEYCNKYYICSEGRPVAKPCPPGLFFNANKDQCDWPENVECDREVAPQPQPEASDEENEGETAPEPVPETDNGSGDENGPIGGGNGDPSEAPEICAAAESDGILIAHEYCNKYYICSEGRPVAKPCPPGLFFNANKDQCDWPENVECDREVAPQPQPEASDEENEGETAPEPVPETDNGSGDENGPIGGGNGDPSEAPEICAAVDSDGILIAHEYCNKYYICSEGRPVAKPCPPGLFFNANKDQCDWPENVECDREVAPQPQPEASDEENEGEIAPEPVPETDNGSGDENGPIGGGNGDPSEAPEICAAVDSDGILTAHEYCNKYYICSEGRPVAKPCPPGLFFNANKDQCDWPENVECDREVAPQPQPEASDEENEGETAPEPVPETDNGSGDENGPIGGGNGDPSEAPEICAAVDSDGILIAHEYCNKYYICSEGRPVAKPCPPGLFFNANKDQCDWPENVECDREVAPQPQPEASDEENEGETAPEPVPEPDNGSGDENGPIGGGNGNPSEAPEICAAVDSDGILIAHEYCNKYYICSEGRPVAKPCPPGLFFNANKDQCDWPENVECDREIAPLPHPDEDGDSGNQVVDPDSEQKPEPVPQPDNGGGNENGPIGGGSGDPSAASKVCAASNSDGILVAHEYCNKFYICSEGKPVALTCPKSLYFNANINKCDWTENVECDHAVEPQPQPDEDDSNSIEVSVPETEPQPDGSDEENNAPVGSGNGDSTQAEAICAAKESDGVLVAHKNCNQFYICNQGKPVILFCPRNLFFNSDTDQCDWPENVECNGNDLSKPENNKIDDKESVKEGNNDPSLAPSLCAADDSDGLLVAHENCHQFYVCSGGNPVALICPQDLMYHPAKEQCYWSDKVDCGTRRVPLVGSFYT